MAIFKVESIQLFLSLDFECFIERQNLELDSGD